MALPTIPRRRFVATLLISTSAAAGEPAPSSRADEARIEPRTDEAPKAHVMPPAEPTEVEIGAYLAGIPRVDPASEEFPSFAAEIFLDLRWRDPRLAFDPEAEGVPFKSYQDASVEELLRDVWWPNIEVENEEGARHIEARTLKVHPDGRVEYGERFAVEVHAEYDLVRFPFDTQRLPVRIESFNWDDRYVVFQPLPSRIGHHAGITMTEYVLRGVAARVESVDEIRSDRDFSSFVLEIELARISGYYLWKLVFPLLLVVAFTWSIFWMTGEPHGTRMQRGFLSLLTLVAYHQVIAKNLPRISYLSFLDGVGLLALLSVGLTLVQIILAHRAIQAGDAARAERLDVMARWLMPGVFFSGLLLLWLIFHGL